MLSRLGRAFVLPAILLMGITAPAPATASESGPASIQREATPPVGVNESSLEPEHGQPTSERPPLRPPARPGQPAARAAAACAVSDFTTVTGATLVRNIRAATTDCVTTLFRLTGADARGAFRESQMVAVADALRADAASYAGDNRVSTEQVVLYLRAGYFVRFYNSTDVGPYGPTLGNSIRGALDAFFASPRSRDVTAANGDILSETVTLVDSAEENARYLSVVKRLLDAYNGSYDPYFGMVAAVNNTYTILFRGHWQPAFVSAVQADPSVLNSVHGFAVRNARLLGTDRSYLVSNAGSELGRFLQYGTLHPTVRPLARDLLSRGQITGPTAALWVAVAAMADHYDRSNCSYYGVCDLQNRLSAAVLPINHTCGSSLRIRAQEMTSAQLTGACASLRGQDAYFHGVARDSGPVANDFNTVLEVVVFDSSRDYRTYAGPMFGIDTNNGGMYLEGDPSRPGNLPRFIAHEAEWLRPAFEIWNLNHEYTHYLDGRYDMYGDFTANISTPTVWWIEGFAEYVSYHYRGVVNRDALTEAGRRTYALSTLFDTTYNHDTTRVYEWGYLAVRYMIQHHRSDVDTILGHYRVGNWQAARTHLTSTIGTRYDTHWYSWLSACASGDCGGGSTTPECIGSDTRALGQNCVRSNRSAAAGNYDHLYIWLPAGVSSLRLTTSGGTGNCDLYYNRTGWATTTAHTQRSTGGSNGETITVTGPPSGYSYVSLYGQTGCSAVTVKSEY